MVYISYFSKHKENHNFEFQPKPHRGGTWILNKNIHSINLLTLDMCQLTSKVD